MKLRLIVLALLAGLTLVPYASGQAPGAYNVVSPFVFDPARTRLVQSVWHSGVGCPTAANLFDGTPFTDSACATGDPQDTGNEGLILAKTGPTSNVAAALAELLNVKNVVLDELGYDIRKPGGAASSFGSHCGAGAPRFNVVIAGVTHFIGCNSPVATSSVVGTGWTRLRWGGGPPLFAFSAATGALVNITGLTADRILILFDEGQDAGPDQFGAAILDNIDVNGVMVGRGSGGR